MDGCTRLNHTARTIAAGLVLMCAGFALSGCGASDDQYAKVLVGTWGSREMAPDDVIVETQFTLLPGGRVNWRAVRDGYLHTRIEFSTLTSLMPVGFAAAWRLKEVNSKEMIYISAANGRTRVEYRKE
jgi:hypothetical protein